MGEPWRIRPSFENQAPSGSTWGTGSNGFGGGLSGLRANWATPTAPSRAPRTTHLERALERQATFTDMGIDPLSDRDLETLTNDPDAVQAFVSVLSDDQLREVWGLLPNEDLTAIRSQKVVMEPYHKARLLEAMRQMKEGNLETEVERKHGGFMDALSGLKDFIADETILGGIWDKTKSLTPPGADINVAGKFMQGYEKLEELVARQNARADSLRQQYGGPSLAEQREIYAEKGMGWRFMTALPRLFGLMSPGYEGYDDPAIWDFKRRWSESQVFIPFLESQTFGAQVAHDIAELGIGSEEGKKAFYKRYNELKDEGVDDNTASLMALRERDDLGTFTKIGIELAADPTVVWGTVLAGAKLTSTGVKASRAALGTFGARKAWAASTATSDAVAQREAVIDQIKQGSDSPFWQAKPAEFDGFLNDIIDEEEVAVRLGADVRFASDMKAAGYIDAEVLYGSPDYKNVPMTPDDAQIEMMRISEDAPWLEELQDPGALDMALKDRKEAMFSRLDDIEDSRRMLDPSGELETEYLDVYGDINVGEEFVEQSDLMFNLALKPMSWKIDRVKALLLDIGEDDVVFEMNNFIEEILPELADPSRVGRTFIESGEVGTGFAGPVNLALDLDITTSPIYLGDLNNPDEWIDWLNKNIKGVKAAEKELVNKYLDLDNAVNLRTETLVQWDNVGRGEYEDEVWKRANDPNSGFWDGHPEKFEDLVREAVGEKGRRFIDVDSPLSNKEILAGIKPRSNIEGPFGILGKIRRAADRSSEIQNLPSGSLDRIALEAEVVGARIQDQGDAFRTLLYQQMQQWGPIFKEIKPMSNIEKARKGWLGGRLAGHDAVFEVHRASKPPTQVKDPTTGEMVWEVDAWEGRLGGIVPKRGHKGASLYFGDIFEIGPQGTKSGKQRRNEIYTGITDEQHEVIDTFQDIYAQLKRIADQNDMPFGTLGDFSEGFAYVSRRSRGMKGVEALARIAGHKVKAGFTKTRFHKGMIDGIKSGVSYDGPLDAMNIYLKEFYNLLAEARMRQHLLSAGKAWVKDVNINTAHPDVVQNVKNLRNKVEFQDKSMALLESFSVGARLTRAQQKMMKDAYPELADKLDDLFNADNSLPWGEADKALVKMFSKKGSKLTLKEAREAIDAVSSTGVSTKQWAGQEDLKRFIQHILRERDAGIEAFDDIEKQAVAILADARKGKRNVKEQAAKVIKNEMHDITNGPDGTRSMFETAQGESRATQERLRGANYARGEAKASSLDMVFTGPNAPKIAKQLDEWLVGQGYPILNFATNLADALRIMKTGTDFGVFTIQGLPLLFRDPEAWGNAFGWSMQTLWDPQARSVYLTHNANIVTEMIKYGGHIGSTEITQSMSDGGWFARLSTIDGDTGNVAKRALGKTSQVTYKTVKLFQSNYDMFLDVARIETYKALKPTIARHGKDADLYDLADFVNKLTGHTSSRALGIGVTQRQLESALFLFSPRYTRAIASLMMDATRGGMRGHEARSALAALMAGQYALHTGISAAMGQEPNYVPGQGNWLKVKVPGLGHVGFGGKPNAMINMIWDIQKQSMENPEGFLNVNIFDNKAYENNAFLRRLRYQTSPLSSGIINTLTGVDPIGRTLPDWEDIYHDDMGNRKFNMRALWTKLSSMGLEQAPFALQGLIESGPVAFGAEFFGAATYPERPYETRDALFNQYSLAEYGMTLPELRKQNDFETRKAELETKYPDLARASEEARDSERQFARNDERVEVRETREAALRNLAVSWNKAAQEFSSLSGSGRTFRQKFWEANKVYGSQIKLLRQTHPQIYADMNAYYEGKGASNEVQSATNALMDRMFSEEGQDYFGNTNYAAIDSIKEDIANVWGEDILTQVEANFTTNMEKRAHGEDGNAHPIVLEFIESIEGLRPYWDIGRERLSPTEWRLWQAYDNASPQAQEVLNQGQTTIAGLTFEQFRDQIEEDRQSVRMENQKIDKWMFLFFGKEPLHPANIR